jgi:hypothetical protein
MSGAERHKAIMRVLIVWVGLMNIMLISIVYMAVETL